MRFQATLLLNSKHLLDKHLINFEKILDVYSAQFDSEALTKLVSGHCFLPKNKRMNNDIIRIISTLFCLRNVSILVVNKSKYILFAKKKSQASVKIVLSYLKI